MSEKINVHSLFSIPFWKLAVEDFATKKETLIKLLAPFDEKINEEDLADFTTNRYDAEEIIKDFSKILYEELKLVADSVQNDLKVTDVWSVTYSKNGYHPVHNHGSIGLSGILYLTLPEDAPKTSFLQPWNNFMTDKSTYGVPDVKEGDIIVVPSFIHHFTQPNKSKQQKRIISWDMKSG